MSRQLLIARLLIARLGGLGIAALLPCDLTGQAEPALVESLNHANFGAWRDHIRTQPTEMDWARLPWLMSFREGLLAAAKAKKPLLLWTMNGHPFGCT